MKKQNKYFISYFISEMNKFGNCDLNFRKIKSIEDVNEISEILKNSLKEICPSVENVVIINWVKLK